MFSEKLMQRLADVLGDIILVTAGTPAERAAYIRTEMESRGEDGNLDEFLAWFPPEE